MTAAATDMSCMVCGAVCVVMLRSVCWYEVTVCPCGALAVISYGEIYCQPALMKRR